MSLILGALAGGAKAVDDIASEGMKSDLETKRAQIMADIQLDRQKALEQSRIEMANTERSRQAEEIGAKREGIINSQLTPEARKFIEDEAETPPRLGSERQRLEADASARRELGYDTRDSESALSRMDSNERADKELTMRGNELKSNQKYRDAELKIRSAAEGRLAKGTNLDNEIKQISLNNAKQVEALKTEFKTATPERKSAINEEVQLLTGKDSDKYLPVPLKDETGAITGYKIFDTKRGGWIDPPGTDGKGAPQIPQGAIDALRKNPGKADDFKAKYKVDPSQYLVDGGSLDPNRFTKTKPSVLKVDPQTGQKINKAEMDRKYGKGTFDSME